MASRVITRFFRIGSMSVNPRFVKYTNDTPTTASFTISNTENQIAEDRVFYLYNRNRDHTYKYTITEHPKEYEQVMNMIKTLLDDDFK